MLLIVIVLILLSCSGLCQGLFEPATFRQSSCTGTYEWTTWFDTNDPDLTQGDLEMTVHIQQLFPEIMCSSPTAIEGLTSVDTSPTTTGDVFRISTKDGFLCLNQQITSYKSKMCSDYKVRYCCPIISG